MPPSGGEKFPAAPLVGGKGGAMEGVSWSLQVSVKCLATLCFRAGNNEHRRATAAVSPL